MVANVLKCSSCGRKYILTADQKDTKYCRICRKVWFEAKKREKEQVSRDRIMRCKLINTRNCVNTQISSRRRRGDNCIIGTTKKKP